MYKFILGVVILLVLGSCGGGEAPAKYMQAGPDHFQKQEYGPPQLVQMIAAGEARP